MIVILRLIMVVVVIGEDKKWKQEKTLRVKTALFGGLEL